MGNILGKILIKTVSGCSWTQAELVKEKEGGNKEINGICCPFFFSAFLDKIDISGDSNT